MLEALAEVEESVLEEESEVGVRHLHAVSEPFLNTVDYVLDVPLSMKLHFKVHFFARHGVVPQNDPDLQQVRVYDSNLFAFRPRVVGVRLANEWSWLIAMVISSVQVFALDRLFTFHSLPTLLIVC